MPDPRYQTQFQYQVRSAIVPPISGSNSWTGTISADSFAQPWSLPVRQSINPRLAIALIVSGNFQSNWLPTVFGDRWNYPWSEPVRFKIGLRPHLHPAYFAEAFSLLNNNSDMESKWHQPWSEPQRLKVNYRRSILTAAQQFWTGPPRLLPPVNVTMTMAATETNTDAAIFAINVYSGANTSTSGQGAKVSIYETGPGGDPVGVRES